MGKILRDRKIKSVDEFDSYLKMPDKNMIIFLSAVIIVFISFIFCIFYVKIPIYQSFKGIQFSEHGVIHINSSPPTVENFAKTSEYIKKDSPVALNPEGYIKSPVDGIVVGTRPVGSRGCIAYVLEEKKETRAFICYVPSEFKKNIRVGMDAQVIPQGISIEPGYIPGKIKSIMPWSDTVSDIAEFLGSEALAREVLEYGLDEGRLYTKVVIELEKSGDDYVWSNEKFHSVPLRLTSVSDIIIKKEAVTLGQKLFRRQQEEMEMALLDK